MTGDFHSLRVAETRSEIGGQAKTVLFEVPADPKETFAWRSGQHVTLCFTLNAPFSASSRRLDLNVRPRGPGRSKVALTFCSDVKRFLQLNKSGQGSWYTQGGQ